MENDLALEVNSLQKDFTNLKDNLDKCQKAEACAMDKLSTKFDKVIFWLIGLFGSTILSLVLLIFNLLKDGKN